MRVGVIVLATAAALTYPATEVLRSVVHRRRERLYGIGGTQDIAMAGATVMLLLCIAMLVYVIAVARSLGR